MSDTIGNFVKEGKGQNPMYDEINRFKTTDEYVDLAKKGIIPRFLLSNNELLPIDHQKILDSFEEAINQEGNYSFLSEE